MAYEHDVFLSYTRRADAGEWVHNHFYPALKAGLENSMPRESRIFTDWQQETGTVWPDNLARALQRSTLLVPVLSPPYFRSPWCIAEWTSMSARQGLLGIGTPDDPPLLIHPVVFADGQHFPENAKSIQALDMRRWNYPFPAFRDTPSYLDFYRAVHTFAGTLAARIVAAPAWHNNWPVIRPDPLPPVRAELPTLQ